MMDSRRKTKCLCKSKTAKPSCSSVTALLTAAGAPVDASALARCENWPAGHKDACAQLDIAEQYYESAKTGIKELDFRCAWAITAALSVYREIGERLRAGGPQAWEGRVSATKGRKIALAIGAMGPAVVRSRVDVTPRDGFYERP